MGIPITLDEYAEFVDTTSQYCTEDPISYTLLGLGGEVGELQNFWKKRLRTGRSVLTHEEEAKMSDELGDVMWYCFALAQELRLDMSEVLEKNQHKLRARQKGGTITNLSHEDQS